MLLINHRVHHRRLKTLTLRLIIILFNSVPIFTLIVKDSNQTFKSINVQSNKGSLLIYSMENFAYVSFIFYE